VFFLSRRREDRRRLIADTEVFCVAKKPQFGEAAAWYTFRALTLILTVNPTRSERPSASRRPSGAQKRLTQAFLASFPASRTLRDVATARKRSCSHDPGRPSGRAIERTDWQGQKTRTPGTHQIPEEPAGRGRRFGTVVT